MEMPRYAMPRYAISVLHFGKFPDPDDFQCWRVNVETDVCVSTQFPQLTMSWINEVEMARSTDDLLTSQSIEGRRDFTWFWNVWCEECVCVEKNHLQYLLQKKSQCWRATSPKEQQILERDAAYLYDLWPLSSNRSLWCSSRSVGFVQYLPTEWRRSRFRYKMRPNLIRNKWNGSGKTSWKVCTNWGCRVPNNFTLCWRCLTLNWIKIK